MDCEKFESTMIDELYGELDELTSAASKRHVAGCARCSALISGLRATRRVATLPVVAPSEGFEQRLLAATREARTAMKPKLGFAEVISWAGRWAMRPQTAMAAVFLLMVGSSGVFLSRKGAPASATASFTVTENGAPDTPAAQKASPPSAMDPMAAAAAHGVPIPPRAAPSPVAAASAAYPNPLATAGPAVAGGGGGPGEAQDDSNSAALDQARQASAAPAAHAARPRAIDNYDNGPYAKAPSAQERDEETKPLPPPPPAVVAGQASMPAKKASDGYATGRAQYAARDYSGAQQTFDGLATQGDVASALWAARSVRDGAGGCAIAAARFDQVAGQSWGTSTGYDATLEGGECYRALGQTDAARTRLARLLTVPAYASRAQADIDAMSQVAAKARRAAPKAAAAAAPASPPSQAQQADPQAAPAAPASK